jgi:hypothetical protein
VLTRYRILRWSLVGGSALCILGAPSCLLSFDDYSEGDVCDAGRDAGIRFRGAPDPVLRGCDAGRASDPDSEASSSGASGSSDAPDASSAGAAEASSAGAADVSSAGARP